MDEHAKEQPAAQKQANREELAKALGISADEIVSVGGVDRPKRDVAFDKNSESSETKGEARSVKESKSYLAVGTPPRLKGNENAQVVGLMAELQGEGDRKEATTTFFKPESFDLEKYKSDPQTYLLDCQWQTRGDAANTLTPTSASHATNS